MWNSHDRCLAVFWVCYGKMKLVSSSEIEKVYFAPFCIEIWIFVPCVMGKVLFVPCEIDLNFVPAKIQDPKMEDGEEQVVPVGIDVW